MFTVAPCIHCGERCVSFKDSFAGEENFLVCGICGEEYEMDRWRLWVTVLKIEDERQDEDKQH